jgi:hypothetical protein
MGFNFLEIIIPSSLMKPKYFNSIELLQLKRLPNIDGRLLIILNTVITQSCEVYIFLLLLYNNT